MTTNVLIVLLFLLIALVSKSAALLLVVSRVTPVHRGRYASKARTLVYLQRTGRQAFAFLELRGSLF
jgi:hypothetical protein